jgi:hypothetical protein
MLCLDLPSEKIDSSVGLIETKSEIIDLSRVVDVSGPPIPGHLCRIIDWRTHNKDGVSIAIKKRHMQQRFISTFIPMQNYKGCSSITLRCWNARIDP